MQNFDEKIWKILIDIVSLHPESALDCFDFYTAL